MGRNSTDTRLYTVESVDGGYLTFRAVNDDSAIDLAKSIAQEQGWNGNVNLWDEKADQCIKTLAVV
jgi:hypothetical protein